MRRKKQTTVARPFSVSPIVSACLGGAILAGLPVTNVHAQDAGRLEKLEQENAALKKRLDAIEEKEGGAASKSYLVKAMGDVTSAASCRRPISTTRRTRRMACPTRISGTPRTIHSP